MPESSSDLQNYDSIVNFAIAAEQSRWERLGIYLLVNSILLLAWARIYVTSNSTLTVVVLLAMCIPGAILGIAWAILGNRTSEYVDRMHTEGTKLETLIPNLHIKPFMAIEEIREGVRNNIKKHKFAFTSARTIVSWIGNVLYFL